MYYTKSMTVYYGTLTEKRKSGYSQWAKVILHVVPAKRRADGSIVTLDLMSQSVAIWADDMFAYNIISLSLLGREIESTEGKSSKGFILEGDAIPEQFRDVFDDFGYKLFFERIDFDCIKYKVDREGRFVMKDNKPISADHIVVGYWEGEEIRSGSRYSKETCIGNALSEWKSLEERKKSLTIVDNNENDDDDNDNSTDVD